MLRSAETLLSGKGRRETVATRAIVDSSLTPLSANPGRHNCQLERAELCMAIPPPKLSEVSYSHQPSSNTKWTNARWLPARNRSPRDDSHCKNGQKLSCPSAFNSRRERKIGALPRSREISRSAERRAGSTASEARFASLVQDAPYGIYRVTLTANFCRSIPPLFACWDTIGSRAAKLQHETDVYANRISKAADRRLLAGQRLQDVEVHWKRRTVSAHRCLSGARSSARQANSLF